jgi:hypothetical protein
MGLIIISIFIIAGIIFSMVGKNSTNQKIYLSVGLLFLVLFLLRFACGKFSCVSNVLLWNIYNCKECTPDWNIRAALDPAGLIFIGLILSTALLYNKDYYWKDVLQSISGINFLGLVIDIRKLDKKIEKLLDEETKLELLEDNVQEKIAEANEHIYKNTTPSNTLQLLKEKLEFEFNRVEVAFNKKTNIISESKQRQFKQLKIATQDLLNLVDKDFTNKYISKTVSFAQKILSMLFNLFDYVQSYPPKRNAKVLKNSIGIIITNDANKEKFDTILKQGDKIPIENSKIYRTKNNNQTSIESTILFESEYPIKNNKQTRRVVISGLPPKPAKQVEIETLFKIDKNGILLVKNIHYETKNIVQEEFDINEYLEV